MSENPTSGNFNESPLPPRSLPEVLTNCVKHSHLTPGRWIKVFPSSNGGGVGSIRFLHSSKSPPTHARRPFRGDSSSIKRLCNNFSLSIFTLHHLPSHIKHTHTILSATVGNKTHAYAIYYYALGTRPSPTMPSIAVANRIHFRTFTRLLHYYRQAHPLYGCTILL